jgi:hypothetical protein
MVSDPLPTWGKGARIKLSQASTAMIVQNQRRLRVSIFFSVKIVASEALKKYSSRDTIPSSIFSCKNYTFCDLPDKDPDLHGSILGFFFKQLAPD